MKMKNQQRLLKGALACVAAFSLAVFICGSMVKAAGGLGQAWSQPLQLSFSQNKSSWFPDTIADASGLLHVTWSGGEEGYNVVYYRSMRSDGAWASATDVFAQDAASLGVDAVTRPMLAMDKQGYLHMTNRVVNIFHSMAPAAQAGDVHAWAKPGIIDNQSPEERYFSNLAIDEQGVIHIVFSENVPKPDCLECTHLFYRQSKDQGQTWSPSIDISQINTGVAKPTILVDANGVLHVVWESGPGGLQGQVREPTTVYYSKSSDGGENWSEPLNMIRAFDLPAGTQLRNPIMAIDGRGQLILASLRLPDDTVYFQLSRDAGETWSSPNLLQGFWGTWSLLDSRLDGYSMAVDSAGHVHMVAAGRSSPDMQMLGLYHLIWDGENWSQPYVIQQPSNNIPLWPRVTVSLGNRLHTVWAMNNDNNLKVLAGDSLSWQIFHSSAVAEAPAVEPLVYPTPAPTPTATPEPILQAVEPTVPASLDRSSSSIDYQSLRTEVDDYSMLLLSGVPVVLFFAAALFIIRRRRA